MSEHRDVLDYIESEPAKTLKKRAGELLHKLGNSGMFYNHPGGVVGHLIRQDRPDFTDGQVATAMRGLGIWGDFVPASAILRDALPMMVHLRRVLLPLTGGYTEKREALMKELGRLARDFEAPDDVAMVKLRDLEGMAEIWLKALSGG